MDYATLAALVTHAVASAITAAVPQPKTAPWSKVWAVLNWLALNVGNARNVS
jgi:hypothetical protein